jgi:hypothetical protein
MFDAAEKFFERIDTRWLIFVLLVGNNLYFPLSGGEEQYLQYAKEWFEPQWIPNSFTLTEFAGTRLVFQIICGFFTQFISIEWFAMIARVVSFALLAIPLARLFKHFGLSNVYIFIILQIFLITDQSFFGKEWMFRTFEPKVVAYFFLFWGLLAFLQQRYYRWVLWLVAATYFHVLVGGWFLLTGLIYLWIQRRNIMFIIKLGAAYVAPLLPFIWYLFNGVIKNSPSEINGVNLNWVYVYYRLPHHLGIFDSWEFFAETHLVGVVLSLFWLVACAWILRRDVARQAKPLFQLSLIILSLNLLFVVVAAVDAYWLGKSGSLGLKFYPFRQSTLAMFFLFIGVTGLILHRLASHPKFYLLRRLALSVVMIIFVSHFVSTVKRNVRYFAGNPSYQQMIDFVRQHTQPTDSFILLKMGNIRSTSEYMKFTRVAERDNFVVFKFVPAGTRKLYDWYVRNQLLGQMEKSPAEIPEIARAYSVNYVISPEELQVDALRKIYENEVYRVYAIDAPQKLKSAY